MCKRFQVQILNPPFLFGLLLLVLIGTQGVSAQITVLENGGSQLGGTEGGVLIEQPILAPENQVAPTIQVLEFSFEAQTVHNPLSGRVRDRNLKWNGCSGSKCTGSIMAGHD